MTLLIDADRTFFLPEAIAYFPRKVDVAGRQEPGIYVVVDALLIIHDLIGIVLADMMDRLALPNQGRDDSIDTLEFIVGDGKSPAALRQGFLIRLMSCLGIIQMPLKMTASALCAPIADIRRRQNPAAGVWYEIRTDFEAFCTRTPLTLMRPPLLARGTDIAIMRTILTMDARIE